MRPATRIYREDGEVGSGWPCFLPDGEHFLFTGNLNNSAGRGNIRLGKLGSLESKKLGATDGRVEYAPGGWVLFLRGRTLLAQKLDLGAGKLVGEPVTLADGVRLGAATICPPSPRMSRPGPSRFALLLTGWSGIRNR